MTQPLFQHRLPFGLAPFQKPSPSTPFFPAFLLPPPPRLTVTLKQPPLPTPRFPPPPQTPSSGPWDAGPLFSPVLGLVSESCALQSDNTDSGFHSWKAENPLLQDSLTLTRKILYPCNKNRQLCEKFVMTRGGNISRGELKTHV
nr:submaxillary gland androgen-regulated protein 3A isoform X4 [Zonotrichia albicollis]